MDEKNIEAQQMELVALQSIYESELFFAESPNPPTGWLIINVRLPENFQVKVESVNSVDDSGCSSDHEILQVEYLTPFTLFFSFPPTYPSDTCPAFLLLCNWLTMDQLSFLCRHLELLWANSGDSILFTWFQFLENEALVFLNIYNCLYVTDLLNFKGVKSMEQLDSGTPNNENLASNAMVKIKPSISGGNGTMDKRALNELPNGEKLLQRIKEYNEFKIEDAFNQNSHLCEICFQNYDGFNFAILKMCKHFFCKECLKGYCEVQIKEGNVGQLNCPDGSCKYQVDDATVRQVVSPDMFKRYDSLLLTRSLEDMKDISYCPRQACLSPVLLEVESKMGICPKCSFTFCPRCKMAYHAIAPCNIKSIIAWESSEREELYNRYMEGDSKMRDAIVEEYGMRAINLLIEESLSEQCIEKITKPCPVCYAKIEKTVGCNKMTCFRCGKYFCWLCMNKLNTLDPYRHYTKGSGCTMYPDDDDGFN